MPLLHRRSDHDVDLRDHDDRYRDDDRRGYVDEDRRGAAVDERSSFTTHEGWNTAVRVLAMVAAALATVIGVVALFRIDWNNGLDSAAVDVAGLAMTPIVAIVTVVAGLLALAAAASPDRGSKLAVGAVLVIAGAAILLIGDGDRLDLQVERAHGWLALGVGAVLLLAGLLLRSSWTARRRVATDRY